VNGATFVFRGGQRRGCTLSAGEEGRLLQPY